jgi:undecaprenyl-phosphate 4-deoxy-4-formamido-L-arabinose transferase
LDAQDSSPTVAPCGTGLSVVIAVYNGESVLGDLVERLAEVLAPLAADPELIFVNDGSTDGSWACIRRAAARRRWVVGIDLAENRGQHNALLCGIRDARGGVIVTMDSDFQHPPEELARLVGALQEGLDLVYGIPRVARHPLWRRAASWLVRRAVFTGTGRGVFADLSGFRAFRASLRPAFAEAGGPTVCLDALLARATTRVGVVRVRHDRRRTGRSGYTLWKLVTLAVALLIAFRAGPLALVLWLGFGSAAAGAAAAGVWLYGGGGMPWSVAAAALALLSGLQVAGLGILGVYFAHARFRGRGRPPYVVRGRTGAAAP